MALSECPNCDQSVNVNETPCANCGRDLSDIWHWLNAPDDSPELDYPDISVHPRDYPNDDPNFEGYPGTGGFY